MPRIKRAAWLALTPREKILHYAQRTIDRLDQAQARYHRLRAAGRIAKPIPFFETCDDDV